MKRISFETAKLAKEKGFIPIGASNTELGYIVNCKAYKDDKLLRKIKFYNSKNQHYLAPYQWELIEWLIKKHNLFITIHLTHDKIFVAMGTALDLSWHSQTYIADSYCDAIEQALEGTLKHINNN